MKPRHPKELEAHGSSKYTGSTLLASSADLGWSTISAELRSHGVSETPVIVRQRLEVCLAVVGNENGLVRRTGAAQCQETMAFNVEVPIGDTCCGTAGDRGLLHPELVISATRDMKTALDAEPADAYISANRTCEMGLLHNTGRPFQSFAYLLEELSRP
jgi:hypothetical protein